MSSYFDSLTRRVAEAAEQFKTDEAFLTAVVDIEGELFRDVTAITGDREFPDDLREKMMGCLAKKSVYSPGDMPMSEWAKIRVLGIRCSRAINDMHSLFHDLARRRIVTRFGILFDSPTMMAMLRDEHDKGK